MYYKIILIIIIILNGATIISGTANQDSPIELDVETAVAIALRNNLGIKSARYDLQKLKWAMATSWNTFIPVVELSSTLTDIHDAIIEDQKADIREQFDNTGIDYTDDMYDTIQKGRVYANFNLTLTINACMVFEIAQTIIDWNNGRLSMAMTQSSLERDIKKAYYHLIILRENINIMEENVHVGQKRFAIAKQKYANQLISELDLLQVHYYGEDQALQLLDMQNKYDNALLGFKQVLQLKENVDLHLTSSIEIGDYTDLSHINDKIPGSIDDNLEVQLQQAALKTLINKRNAAIALLTPSFNVSLLFDPTYGKNDPLGKDDGWFNDVSDNWRQNAGNISLTLSMPVSVFVPFSKEQMNIINTNFDIKKQKLLITEAGDEVKRQVTATLRTIEAAYKSINVLELQIKRAQKLYLLIEASYNSGIKTLLEVKEAERELNTARLQLLQSKYDYMNEIITLEYLLNKRLPT